MELRDPDFGNAMTLVPTSRPRPAPDPDDDWLVVSVTFEVAGHRWTESRELMTALEASYLASWLIQVCDVGTPGSSGELQGSWQLNFLEPDLEIQAWPHPTEIAFTVLLSHGTRPAWAKEASEAEAFRLEFGIRVPVEDVRKAAATLSAELDRLGL
jgi:hypothetical protein